MTPKTKTILIVEDSAVQALDIRQRLERKGLRVLWASNGQTGVALARKERPDIVVLDIEMPVMDGFEAGRLLKQAPETAGIPLIMLTAHSEPELLERGMQQGMTDFIPKDIFSAAVMLETLRQLHIVEEDEPDEGKMA